MAETTFADLVANAAEGSGGATLIPDNVYPFFVESAKAETATTGKPMIVAKLVVVGGPYDGRWVYNNFVVSEDNGNALGIFFRHMEAMGLPQASIVQLGPVAYGLPTLAEWMLNRQAMMVVGHRIWQQQPKNEVNDIRPLTAVGGVPSAPAVPAIAPAPVQAAPAPVAAPVPAQPPAAPVAPAAVAPAPVAPVAPTPVAPVAPQPVAPVAPAAPVVAAPPLPAAPVAAPAAPAAVQAPPVQAVVAAPPAQAAPVQPPGGAGNPPF